MFKMYPLTGIGMDNFNYGCVNDERFNGNACLLSIYIDISYITLNI